jgi:cytochrome bd ubiquinol oxidase subunit II
MSIEFDINLLAFLITGFSLILYTVLDGFDLGIGMLFPFAKSEQEKDFMMNAIAPVWDGNETWLIFGGVALFAFFPTAYATILSSYYLPIMIMLFALIFRGVAFEFRFKTIKHKQLWGRIFYMGSATAAASQGLILGHLLQGFNQVEGGADIPLINTLSIMTALGVMAGYSLLGLLWLHMKAPAAYYTHYHNTARWLAPVVAVFIALLSITSIVMVPEIYDRWLNPPSALLLIPVITALLLGYISWSLHTDVEGKYRRRPFMLMMLVVPIAALGLVTSIFPYLIPGQLTYLQAATHESSAQFTMVGVLIMLPIILAYTLWGYRIFKGEVDGEGYH